MQARERLDPSEERRLLALVRSANDSPDDVAMYMERAHGFLPKCPTEPDRKAILRQWLVRHGTSTIKRFASRGMTVVTGKFWKQGKPERVPTISTIESIVFACSWQACIAAMQPAQYFS